MMIRLPEIKFGQKWLLFGYGLSLPGKIWLRETHEQLSPTYENLWHELSHSIDWQTGYTRTQYVIDAIKARSIYHSPAEIRARRFATYHMHRFVKSGLSWEKYLELTVDEINRFL